MNAKRSAAFLLSLCVEKTWAVEEKKSVENFVLLFSFQKKHIFLVPLSFGSGVLSPGSFFSANEVQQKQKSRDLAPRIQQIISVGLCPTSFKNALFQDDSLVRICEP